MRTYGYITVLIVEKHFFYLNGYTVKAVSTQTHKNQTLSSQDISCAGWLAIISCWWSLRHKSVIWHLKNLGISSEVNLMLLFFCFFEFRRWMDGISEWIMAERQKDSGMAVDSFWYYVTSKIHYFMSICANALKTAGVTACRKCDRDQTSRVNSGGNC